MTREEANASRHVFDTKDAYPGDTYEPYQGGDLWTLGRDGLTWYCNKLTYVPEQ